MTQARYIPQGGSTLTLPENAAIVRLVAGDSLCEGSTGTAQRLLSALKETEVRAGAAVTTPIYRQGAFFWNKWVRLIGGVYSATYRTTLTSEADNAWEQLHDRTGWMSGTITADLASLNSLGLLWVIEYFANRMPQYRGNQSGQALPIYYIVNGAPSSVVGDAPHTSAGDLLNWAPVNAAGAYERYMAHYVAPAVNALRADGKDVFIESMFFTGGGGDTATAAYAASNGFTSFAGATVLGQSLDEMLNAMALRTGGRVPAVLIRPYATGSANFADYTDAQVSFDAQFDAFGDGFVDYIHMEGVPRQETWPGIHPTSDGLVMMAQRYAEAVSRLASRGARLVHITEDLA